MTLSYDAEAHSYNLNRLAIELCAFDAKLEYFQLKRQDGTLGVRMLLVHVADSTDRTAVSAIVEAHNDTVPETPDEKTDNLKFNKRELAALFLCVDTASKPQWVQDAVRDARQKI